MRTPEERRAYFRAYYQANKERYAGYHKKNYAKNKQKVCDRSQAWALANPIRRSATVRRWLYGTDGKELFTQQDGLCGICRVDLRALSTARRHLDHCHETGNVRGWLCSTCNFGLGKLGDNIDGILRALYYLLKTK